MELSSNVAVEFFATTTLVGLLFLLVFLKIGKSDSKKRYRLPPGPRPWPILGNLPMLGPLVHQDFKRLADKYGPIVYLRLGSVDAIVISSPDLAEEVLKTKDPIFASRPLTSQGKILAYDHSGIISAPYGPFWRHARKVFTLELMTAKQIQQFQNDRETEVLQALGSIIHECKDGKAIPIDHTLWKIVSRNICRMAFGKTFTGDSSRSFTDTESRVYEKINRRLSEMVSVFIPGDFIPMLRYFDFFGHKKQMREIAQQMDRIVEKIIEEHLQENLKRDAVASDNEKKDLVDVLLTRPAADHKTPLTRDNVKGLLEEVLAAGTDTTITTVSWAFTDLLKNPSTLESAQDELDKVIGRNRLVRETDLPRLPYVQAIVKEVFRLHPIAPLLVPHESLEASTLGDGYYIPNKCRVFVNTWAMGRDPNLWENPLNFNPGRFLNTGIDSNGQTFKYLPFGSGRRTCPGRPLGLTMAEYSLAAMLHACSWALPDGMSPEDLDMTEAPGLTVPKMVPLETVASPRLPLSVIFSSE